MSSTNSGENQKAERRHVNTDGSDRGVETPTTEGATSSTPVPLPTLPSPPALASATVSFLLFGGLLALFVGSTWAVLSVVGVAVAVAVAGVGMVVYAFVLARVFDHLGLI